MCVCAFVLQWSQRLQLRICCRTSSVRRLLKAVWLKSPVNSGTNVKTLTTQHKHHSWSSET